MAMGSSNVDVDMETGEPIQPQRAKAEHTVHRRLGEQERMRVLADALASPDGQRLMRVYTNHLAELIEEFVNKDPACVALLTPLRAVGYHLDVGTRAAEALVAMSVGQAPEGTPSPAA